MSEQNETAINTDLFDKMVAAVVAAYEPDDEGAVSTQELYEAMLSHWPAKGLTADIVADALSKHFTFAFDATMKQFVWRMRAV